MSRGNAVSVYNQKIEGIEESKTVEQVLYEYKIEGMSLDRLTRDFEYSMSSRHFHDSYELYFLLEGERYYFIDRETYLVQKGMAVLIKRNQIHKTTMAGTSYHDRILLQLKGEVFDKLLKEHGLPSLEEMFELNSGVMAMSQEDWAQVTGLLSQLREELEHKREHFKVLARLHVIGILVCLYRCRKSARLNASTEVVRTAKYLKVHEIADYLLNHSDTKESLEELAKRFFISRAYICRIFKQVTGFTINEYQNLAKIKKAQELLVHSSRSVTEVAELAGYESITYFERMFKRYTDMTPTEYRRNNRRTPLGLE